LRLKDLCDLESEERVFPVITTSSRLSARKRGSSPCAGLSNLYPGVPGQGYLRQECSNKEKDQGEKKGSPLHLLEGAFFLKNFCEPACRYLTASGVT